MDILRKNQRYWIEVRWLDQSASKIQSTPRKLSRIIFILNNVFPGHLDPKDNVLSGHHLHTLRKKCFWIKSISFQKHVYHGFKSICYIELVTYLLVLVVYFYELRGQPGLERRKLHDIRHSFLGCITYEMFQVLLK